MTIGRKVQPAMNVAIREIIGPTVQAQRARNRMMEKSPTRKRICHVKNQPKQRKIRRNTFNFYKTQIMKQVTTMTNNLRNLDSEILEAKMN